MDDEDGGGGKMGPVAQPPNRKLPSLKVSVPRSSKSLQHEESAGSVMSSNRSVHSPPLVKMGAAPGQQSYSKYKTTLSPVPGSPANHIVMGGSLTSPTGVSSPPGSASSMMSGGSPKPPPRVNGTGAGGTSSGSIIMSSRIPPPKSSAVVPPPRSASLALSPPRHIQAGQQQSLNSHSYLPPSNSGGGNSVNSPPTSDLRSLAQISKSNKKTLSNLSKTGTSPRRLPALELSQSTATGQPPAATELAKNATDRSMIIPTNRTESGGDSSMLLLGNGYAMFCEPWKQERAIGKGQFGTVYMARNLRNGEFMAVKQMKVESVKMLEQSIDEVVLMCRASFRNQNVVNCMGWSVSDECTNGEEDTTSFGMEIQNLDGLDKMKAVGKQFNIFMEYVSRGSIASLLEKNGPLNEVMVRNFMRQLLIGLRSLHAAGIAHRDIKGQNLLLSEENVLKVADFGCAKKVANETFGQNSSIIGSIPWMSPEVIRQEVGKKGDDDATKLTGWKLADVWSVGMTMIEMITGKAPWENYSNPAAMMFAIAASKEPPKLPDESVIHPDGIDFLSKCCAIDPKERPSVAKLIYHPYMRPENVDENGNYMPQKSASDILND